MIRESQSADMAEYRAQTNVMADAQRDGRPAEYRWRPLRKFRNSRHRASTSTR